MKNWKELILPSIFILYFILSYISFCRDKTWWRFATKGEIYSNPQLYKGYIYFGNNDGRFYAVDEKIGKEKWSFKTGYEIFTTPIFHRNKVLFTSSDKLFALDVRNGREIWRFTTDGFYRFITDIKIHKNIFYAGDADGTLYAINANGKPRWKVRSRPVKKIDSILVGGWPNWFGRSFEIKGNYIYWGSSDGNLYVLNLTNGKLKWKFDSKDTISTSILLVDGKIIFGNRNGKVFVLSQKNGKVLNSWRKNKSPIYCLSVLEKKLPWQSPPLLISHGDGSIVKTSSDGNKLWGIKEKSSSYLCPFEEKFTVYITGKQGELKTLNSNTGKIKWKINIKKPVSLNPFLHRVGFTSKIYLSDSDGVMHTFKLKTGKEIWNFRTGGGISTYPVITNNYFFISSTDGGIYRVNKYTGKGTLPYSNKYTFNVSQNFVKVNKNKIIELDVKFDDTVLTNPWRDASIKARFVHETGNEIFIDGFYHDKNLWKVRFSPKYKGLWRWNLNFNVAGNSLVKNGSFKSEADTSLSYLKISKYNRKRLTLDEKTIFNGLGFQDSIWDTNQNGNPLDDFATGQSYPIVASESGNTLYIMSSDINQLDEHLSIYGKKGGFNLYRYNVANASYNLWELNGIRSGFLLNEGKWADVFMQSLRKNNYQIIMAIFGFGIPFSNMSQIEKKELTAYIDYVVARYGAYVSVWEIANEAGLPDNLVKFIAETIRKNDFEKKPISVSWEKPYHDNINIISPHWYESEPIEISDLRTVQVIEQFSDVKKPVIVGEQGNHLRNWDETSAIRMRVRAWTAFFNEAVLIFWNASEKKDTLAKNPKIDYTYANQYIGNEERRYMKILQDFTSNTDIDVKKTVLTTNDTSVRGYGLFSTVEGLGYLYHFEDHKSFVSTGIELNLPKAGEIEWIDPSSGKTILLYNLAQGYNYLTSPGFYLDLAFKIKFDQSK